MASTITPATDRQMAYLRKLVTGAGREIHEYLIEQGITELKGFPRPETVARMPSKSEASRLIDALAPARSSSGASYRGRGGYRGRSRYVSTRCTHEDYPCCGCDQ